MLLLSLRGLYEWTHLHFFKLFWSIRCSHWLVHSMSSFLLSISGALKWCSSQTVCSHALFNLHSWTKWHLQIFCTIPHPRMPDSPPVAMATKAGRFAVVTDMLLRCFPIWHKSLSLSHYLPLSLFNFLSGGLIWWVQPMCLYMSVWQWHSTMPCWIIVLADISSN